MARTLKAKAPLRSIEVVDLFCGAGGTSTGILQACEELGLRVNLTAVNHWDTAINTHTLNLISDHAKGIYVHHICEPVENLWPARVIPSRRLHLLSASCECTFHSLARGGGPCNEQSRSQPWQLIRWCSDIQVDNLQMENVREWVNWGPIYPCSCGTKNPKKHRKKSCLRPIPERKGEYFRAFVQALRDMGYHVDWRIQNAADHGDPTARKRLILLASLHHEIKWPKESHGPGRRHPYRTARQIIDWTLKGKSIFGRKKPLSDNTLRRIATGLQKFGGAAAEPFLVMMYGTNDARSVGRPMPTVTSSGNHIGLAQPKPFIVPQQRFNNRSADPVDKPLRTITTGGGRLFNLIQPSLKHVKPFVIHSTHHGKRPAHSLKKPLPTITAAHRGELALVEPFIVSANHGGDPRRRVKSINQPLPTVTTCKSFAVIDPVLIQTDQTGGNGACNQSIDQPLKTIVSKQNTALVQPYIVKYYGSGTNCDSVHKPLATITTKDRFLLVEPKTGQAIAELDILFRMLQPHELSAAMSFPKNYKFTGNKEDAVMQIGNAVPVKLARAHARALLLQTSVKL